MNVHYSKNLVNKRNNVEIILCANQHNCMKCCVQTEQNCVNEKAGPPIEIRNTYITQPTLNYNHDFYQR